MLHRAGDQYTLGVLDLLTAFQVNSNLIHIQNKHFSVLPTQSLYLKKDRSAEIEERRQTGGGTDEEVRGEHEKGRDA